MLKYFNYMQEYNQNEIKESICTPFILRKCMVPTCCSLSVPADRIELSCNQLLFQRLMRVRRYTGICGNGRSRSACDLTHHRVSNPGPLLENSYFQSWRRLVTLQLLECFKLTLLLS